VPVPPAPGATRFVCEADGLRLDRFVADHTQVRTRRRTASIIAAGAVRVNGRAARKGCILRRGDVVEIDPLALADVPPPPQADLALPILYEDDALIAVDKPSGMPSVALRAGEIGTVANFLLARAPDTAAAGRTALEAGLVHRLDTGTSGVLLAARSAPAWRDLRAQFRRHAVRKQYLAWVDGDVAASGVRREPIAHDPRRAHAMLACRDAVQAQSLRARPALTRYRPRERRGRTTLLAVEIATGVRHQIRVHLAAAGHPVCGDALYGGSAAPRLMLHAALLGVRHPVSRRALSIDSPPPGDFLARD
jgi:23S rRNA pseudouridine1911/1915/1917 synthase